MTENDIIKALEDYRNSRIIFTPKGVISIGDIIDLINRQKAEIERLNGISDRLNDICTDQDLEIERLHAEIEESNETEREAELQALTESKENAKLFCEAINHAKTEAIKEFAERLKEGEVYMRVEFPNTRNGTEAYVVLSDDIDNLVKEMTTQPTKIEHNSLCETESYEVKE